MPLSSERYDVVVAGVGAMGSAAIFHLAQRGVRVLGLERYDVPNAMGSSHGSTRIIRLAYFESPEYVPLLRRAYELWAELERAQGEQLLVTTGCLDAGRPGSRVLAGADLAARSHGVPVERLAAREVARRFPGFRLPEGFEALLDPAGGFLLPERCIVAHVEQALALGAVVRAREAVLGWEARADGIHVRTERGEVVAGRLVLAAGAWMEKLGAVPAGILTPERQVLAWFQPRRPELFTPQRCPVWILETEEHRQYYGFPVHGVPGFKLGRMHHLDEPIDPDDFDREPGPRDEALLRGFTERVVVVSPCSGHGFKFSSAVGEIAAELALDGASRHDIGFLRSSRFATA